MKTSDLNWDNLRLFLKVARAQSVLAAANTLGVDHSTVTRRLKRLENEVGSVLFHRSVTGHELTAEGHRLIEYVEKMESLLYDAEREVAGHTQALSGEIRIGATEGFGAYFLAPHLAKFSQIHRAINIDLLALPRFVSLSKREADMSISIERSVSPNHVVSKLSEYRLYLYASQDYLKTHPSIQHAAQLRDHTLVGYVDDMCYSSELKYLQTIAPEAPVPVRSTSLIAQFATVSQGLAMAVLPHFLAATNPRLVRILPEEIQLTRTFWLATPHERREIVRIRVLWDYLRAVAQQHHAFLMGEEPGMVV